jgi:hypothetical protein
MNNLTTEQMQEVAQTFIDSYAHVLANYIGETKDNITKFTADIVLRHKSYMLVGYEGLPNITDIVFNNEEYRDFILTLHYTFFSRWGQNEATLRGLIGNLARGVGISNLLEMNALPKPINSRLLFETTAVEILTANKWLIIILLLQLFIVIDTKL